MIDASSLETNKAEWNVNKSYYHEYQSYWNIAWTIGTETRLYVCTCFHHELLTFQTKWSPLAHFTQPSRALNPHATLWLGNNNLDTLNYFNDKIYKNANFHHDRLTPLIAMIALRAGWQCWNALGFVGKRNSNILWVHPTTNSQHILCGKLWSRRW